MIFLSLIPCSQDCKYQDDGYCMLETPTIVTNIVKETGCVHYVRTEKKSSKYGFDSLTNTFYAD